MAVATVLSSSSLTLASSTILRRCRQFRPKVRFEFDMVIEVGGVRIQVTNRSLTRSPRNPLGKRKSSQVLVPDGSQQDLDECNGPRKGTQAQHGSDRLEREPES